MAQREESNMDVLVSIGRFSEMTRLSVKALRHYHHIGLLEPAEVDSQTGYRYYHVGQANQAEAIRVLRSLDMPLEAVADVLASDEPDLVAKLLEHHRLRLQENLDHQQRMLAYLEQLINKETTLMPYEITVKDVPTINIASIRIHTGVATVGRDVPNAAGATRTTGSAACLRSTSAGMASSGRRPTVVRAIRRGSRRPRPAR